MTADRLHEAAKVLRERAEGSSAGPWRDVADADSGERFVATFDGRELAQVAEWSTGLWNATYIATVDPLVGLALADWLDVTAKTMAPNRAAYAEAVRLSDLILGDRHE